MSNNGSNGKIGTGRKSDGTFNYGNTFKVSLPYEIKLIRDSVKSAIYSAVAGLAMTKEKAEEYYSRPGATLLENIFAESLATKKYDILEKFFDRIIGKPAMQVLLTGEEGQRTMIDELTDEQKRNAIESAYKTLESTEEK